jgi:hypothetical protein
VDKDSEPSESIRLLLTVSVLLNGLLLGNLAPDYKESLAIIRKGMSPVPSQAADQVPSAEVARVAPFVVPRTSNPPR